MPLFTRNPTKKLKKAYERKMESAMQAMRRGDVKQNALLVAEAEKIRAEITDLDEK
ncbi:MAG: DUF6435 family protein [Pseudomonadales bacterium]